MSMRHHLLAAAAGVAFATGSFAYGQNQPANQPNQPNQPGAQELPPNTLDPTMRNPRGGERQPTDRPDAKPGDYDKQGHQDKDKHAQHDKQGQYGKQGQFDQNAAAGDARFMEQIRQVSQDPKNASEKVFVLYHSLANQSEIALAEEALKKSRNDQVRQIAQKMITEHRQAAQKLQSVAQAVGVEPVTQVPQFMKHQNQVLTNLPEEQFNKAYLSHLKAGHAYAISMFQDYAKTASNEQLKQYAKETLSTLQQHRKEVAQAGQSLGLASGDLSELPGN